MNYCTKCGNLVKPDDRFCGTCGEIVRLTTNETTQELANGPQLYSGSGMFTPSDQDFKMNNSQQRIVNLWLILGSVFLVCVFLPSFIGLEGMDGGFAMSFISGFLVITSIIVILIYRSRAKILSKILSGEGRITTWRYTAEEWLRFVSIDFEQDKKIKKSLFILISVIALIVGIILTIALKDFLLFIFSAAVIPLVAIPALWAPRYRYRKLKNSESKALIAENGVIVGKMFHLWIRLGARLDSVTLNMKSDPELIEFSYSFPTRTGRQEEIARVPVPYGKMDEAKCVVEHFNNRLSHSIDLE
jgi:hypothetical protein